MQALGHDPERAPGAAPARHGAFVEAGDQRAVLPGHRGAADLQAVGRAHDGLAGPLGQAPAADAPAVQGQVEGAEVHRVGRSPGPGRGVAGREHRAHERDHREAQRAIVAGAVGVPPRVAVIINKKNLTHELIVKSGLFAASILEESTPMIFLGPFGFKSGRDVDKLSKVAYKKGITGCPLITEHALSVLEAEVFDQIDLGTHTVFIGNVVSSEVLKEGVPLTYQYYHTVLKGYH